MSENSDLGHLGSSNHGETRKQAMEDHIVVESYKVTCQQMINAFQCENKMDLLDIGCFHRLGSCSSYWYGG